VEISDLILTENAYFYRKQHELGVDVIESIFDNVIREKEAQETILRITRQVFAVEEILASCLVFRFSDSPSFVDSRIVDLQETRYGYLLLLESDEFIIISRRNAPGLRILYKYVQELEYEVVAGLYVSDQTLFERFHMQNMDFADAAMRSRTLEALNLQESLPILSTQRYVLKSMRLTNNYDRMAIAISTSRINRIGARHQFSELLEWIKTVVKRIKEYTPHRSFINSFPEPIDFESTISTCTPRGILFTLDNLVEEFEKGRVRSVSYVVADSRKFVIPTDGFLRGLGEFARYITIGKNLSTLKRRAYSIPNITDKTLRIYINRKSIVLWGKKMKKVSLLFDPGDYERGLLEYMNRRHQFILTFSPPNIIYYGRNLFRDSNLINNVTRLLDIFFQCKELLTTKSEKGKQRPSSKQFPRTSLFSFVENTLAMPEEKLVCDDLGEEWADYIGLRANSVVFYHAKHSRKGMSASAFHEVVSQAQKNLCRYTAANTEWSRKLAKWKKLYAGTRIARLRRGISVEDLLQSVNNVLEAPNSDKLVFLVVDFISKDRLSEEIRRIGKNRSGARPQVIQMLWLLSSLASMCMEFGVKLTIVCRP